MNKSNIVLSALAVLLVVAIFLVSGETGASTAGVSTPGVKPFEGLDKEKVQRIEITDEDGRSIAVEKQPAPAKKPETAEGEATPEAAWAVASLGGFPARPTKAGELAGKLGQVVLGRTLSRKPKNFTRLKVSDEGFSRHVVMKGEGGAVLADFYIGEGGKRFDVVHFRRAGEEVAYQATGLSTWDFGAEPSAWVDTKFTDFDPEKVTALTLKRGAETVEIRREEREKPAPPKEEPPKEGEKPKEGEPPKDEEAPKEGEPPKDEAAPKEGEKKEEKPPEKEKVWVLVAPEGPKDLDKGKTDSLVRGIARLYFADPIGRKEGGAYGFDAPTATATLAFEDGTTKTVTVGSKREKEADYFATYEGFDYVVTLRSYSVTDYFEKKVADLLPEPKTPEEAPKDEGEDKDD